MINRLTKLTIGAASLMTVAGVAMADVPQQTAGDGNDFDRYTVDASGNIIYDAATSGSGTGTACPNNATCTVLEATGPGILQQRVQYDGDGTFYQTIIVDDGAASVTDPSTGLAWRMENYVLAGNSGPQSDQTTLLVVKSGLDPLAHDYMSMEFEGAEGNLVGADASTGTGQQAAERIHQINNSGTNGAGTVITRQTEFFYEDNGPGGKRMGINMQNPNNEGQFTLRKVTGNYVTAGGTLALQQGDQFTYAAGDNLQVINIQQAASGTGAQADRMFGMTQIQHLVDNEGLTVGGATYVAPDGLATQTNIGAFGATTGVTISLPAGTPITGAGNFMAPWNTALFGAAPLSYVSNGTGTGAAAPGGITPGGTPEGGFWTSPPPWFQIVP